MMRPLLMGIRIKREGRREESTFVDRNRSRIEKDREDCEKRREEVEEIDWIGLERR